MTDSELVAKKLALIETYIRELRELARLEKLATDVRERRFIEHTLQLLTQAAIDVASHIVSDDRLGEPSTNRELFETLAREGWVGSDLVETLGRMAGFRNIVVHGYAELDPAVVENIVRHHLGDLLTYVDGIRTRMG